jgi:hypothetical protein
MELVSTAELSISYDGEILRTGLMDVQELAPALLASGTLIQKANRLVNGETTHVSLKVKSDFRRGSFLVDFIVDQSLLEQAKNFLLAHPGIKDARTILEMLFFWVGIPASAGASFFKLIKFLRNRKPDSVVFQEKHDTVMLALGDQRITVNKNIYNMYQDPEARRAASTLVAPLNTEGIETLEIRRGEEIETVTKEEAEAFSYSQLEGEVLLDNVREAWLSVIALSFNPDHKWRFSDGITAVIQDKAFWDRIHRHEEIFEEADQLLVMLRTTTTRDEKGALHSLNVIEKVLQHVHTPKQAKLL